jgi:hypothetical protein
MFIATLFELLNETQHPCRKCVQKIRQLFRVSSNRNFVPCGSTAYAVTASSKTGVINE